MSNFCKCKSYSHFFSKNISTYATFNDQSFNNALTNDIVSFEQLGQENISEKGYSVKGGNSVKTDFSSSEKGSTLEFDYN